MLSSPSSLELIKKSATCFISKLNVFKLVIKLLKLKNEAKLESQLFKLESLKYTFSSLVKTLKIYKIVELTRSNCLVMFSNVL